MNNKDMEDKIQVLEAKVKFLENSLCDTKDYIDRVLKLFKWQLAVGAFICAFVVTKLIMDLF